MSYTGNLPGNIRHAPGVVCYVVGEHPKNNGKVVVIQHEIFRGSRYLCGCGAQRQVPELLGETIPIWDVTGKEIYCGQTLRLFGFTVADEMKQVTHRPFLQSQLIPIADSDTWNRLFESEATDEQKEKLAENLTINEL